MRIGSELTGNDSASQPDQDKGSCTDSESSEQSLLAVRKVTGGSNVKDSLLKKDSILEADKVTLVAQSELYSNSVNDQGSEDSDLNAEDRMLQRLILVNFMARQHVSRLS